MGNTKARGFKPNTGGAERAESGYVGGREGQQKPTASPGKERTMKRTQRFERRLKDAQEGNEIEVMKTYKREIEMQRTRMNASKNGFIRTCCQQEIDQLKAEKDAIEMEVVG